MRRDMPKLLVHTSRTGGPKNNDVLRTRRSKIRVSKAIDFDWDEDEVSSDPEEWVETNRDDPKVATRGRVAMRQKRHGKFSRKEFGENLKPLARFLASNVGRPWDKVYSEIRDVCEPSGTVNAHIYQHLWDMVRKDVFIGEDGKIWERSNYTPERPLVAPQGAWWSGFYVHPVHGLLCKTPNREKRSRQYESAQHQEGVREDRVVIIRKTGQVWLSRVNSDLGTVDWFALTMEVGLQNQDCRNYSEDSLNSALVSKGFEAKAVHLAVSELLRPHRKSNNPWELMKNIEAYRLRGPIPHHEVGQENKRAA